MPMKSLRLDPPPFSWTPFAGVPRTWWLLAALLLLALAALILGILSVPDAAESATRWHAADFGLRSADFGLGAV